MDLAFIKGNNKLSVRVGLILQYKNEILLLKKDFNNYYVLPGGHVKFGEFLEESIKLPRVRRTVRIHQWLIAIGR